MKTKSTISLQSVVDTHEQAFVIIDRDFRIVAVNRAYEQAYGSRRDKMVGQHCYQISHKNDKPCFELGEDCPHQQVYQTGQGCSCQHTHYDTGGRAHQVRINAYPLQETVLENCIWEKRFRTCRSPLNAASNRSVWWVNPPSSCVRWSSSNWRLPLTYR